MSAWAHVSMQKSRMESNLGPYLHSWVSAQASQTQCAVKSRGLHSRDSMIAQTQAQVVNSGMQIVIMERSHCDKVTCQGGSKAPNLALASITSHCSVMLVLPHVVSSQKLGQGYFG